MPTWLDWKSGAQNEGFGSLCPPQSCNIQFRFENITFRLEFLDLLTAKPMKLVLLNFSIVNRKVLKIINFHTRAIIQYFRLKFKKNGNYQNGDSIAVNFRRLSHKICAVLEEIIPHFR